MCERNSNKNAEASKESEVLGIRDAERKGESTGFIEKYQLIGRGSRLGSLRCVALEYVGYFLG